MHVQPRASCGMPCMLVAGRDHVLEITGRPKATPHSLAREKNSEEFVMLSRREFLTTVSVVGLLVPSPFNMGAARADST